MLLYVYKLYTIQCVLYTVKLLCGMYILHIKLFVVWDWDTATVTATSALLLFFVWIVQFALSHIIKVVK